MTTEYERYRNIEILYEDNHLLVVNKPAGMLSQSDITGQADLQSILKMRLKEKYQKPGKVFLALVQRLDRPTSGLMVLARTSKAASRLSDQIRKRTITKEYLAVVETPKIRTGTITHYLQKDEKEKKARIFNEEKQNCQKAVLEVRLIATHGSASLVAVTLKTGRFHQIRAQLAAAGMPISGDRKYGNRPEPEDARAINNQSNKKSSLKKSRHSKKKTDPVHGDSKEGLALFCNTLQFQHPTRNQAMTFRLDLPDHYPWNMFR